MQGQGIRVACEKRRDELKSVLAFLGKERSPATRKDIEDALSSLEALLIGDLENIPTMVSEQLSRWLEQSKYLGLKELREMPKA